MDNPLVDVGDLERIGFGRTVAAVDEPPDGFERVLEVTIPGTATFEGSRIAFEADGDPRFRSTFDLEIDRRTRRLLVGPFASGERVELVGLDPSIDLSTRLVLGLSDGLLDELAAGIEDPRKRQLGREIAREAVVRHEYGGDDARGHFQTVIHPEKAPLDSLNAWEFVQDPEPTAAIHLPRRYHEVRAIAEEERLFDRLGADGAVGEVASQVREASMRLRARTDAYAEVLDVLSFLHDHLAPSEVADALDVAAQLPLRTADPDVWLCYVLYDLQAGVRPGEFRSDSAFWEAYDREFEECRAAADDQRRFHVEDDFERCFQSTYEAFVVDEDAVRRRWFAYEPPSSYSVGHVNHVLFAREKVERLQRRVRPLNDGFRPTEHHAFRYQDEGMNPFGLAMAGEITPGEIRDLFGYRFDREGYNEVQFEALGETVTRLDFSASEELQKWRATGADGES